MKYKLVFLSLLDRVDMVILYDILHLFAYLSLFALLFCCSYIFV